MKSLISMLFLALSPLAVSAQDTRPEIQLRLPLHFQIPLTSDVGATDRFGFASWAILPNVVAPKDPLSTLLLAGLLWQYKKSWTEFMVGSRLDQHGYVDPMLNLRFVNNQIPGVTISGEIQQTFRQERKRFLDWAAVDGPTLFWKVRAGIEAENTIFPSKKDSWSLGPRLAMPVPLDLPSHMKVSLVPVYHFRYGRDFVRVYAITNFNFP